MSLLNIADGALNELTNIVTRLSELAEQSSNGTFSNKQRLALDKEAQSLSKEYNRIARTTEFNGRKLFNSDFGDLSLAAGGGRETLVEGSLGGVIGDGTFQANISMVWETSLRVEAFDINYDGNLDILSSSSTGVVSVSIGNGDGTFKSRTTYVAGTSSAGIEISDFNNDGYQDVIVADTGTNSVYVLMGNYDGTFKSSSSYVSSAVSELTIVDVNGDNIEDIVSANVTQNSIQVYIGNANGSFSTAVTYLAVNARDVKSADIDGDGYSDLIVGTTSPLLIFKGNSNGTFQSAISYAGVSGFEISLGDVDNDGNLDVLQSFTGSNSIFFGNSDGIFKIRQAYFVGTNPRSSLLKDLNGDGSLDIVATNLTGSSTSVLLGNGDGTFRDVVSYAGGANPRGLDIGDINNDGALDIINVAATSVNILVGNYNNGVAALQSFSLKTQLDSLDSLTYLRQVQMQISGQRGQIGAFQSRLDVATSTLRTSSLNYQEANSRITDIDLAEES